MFDPNNPALRAQPRHQPAPILPPRENASLLDWLEANGRLAAREPSESYADNFRETSSDELTEFISDPTTFDFDEEEDVEDF